MKTNKVVIITNKDVTRFLDSASILIVEDEEKLARVLSLELEYDRIRHYFRPFWGYRP